VFSVSTSGSGFNTLYSFGGFWPYDGVSPWAELTLSGSTLYGTTASGGLFNWGTVFRVNTDGSNFATLYCFEDSSDGSNPEGGLLLSGTTLYGTTAGNGTNDGSVFSMPTAP
jgi:uncharacterized repeat protein (TIGR03803 family)